MATLTNSIRWTRRGNSQFRNKSTSLIDTATEAFKLPALNALNKSIKYGDLSFATHHDLRKLRKEPDQPENIEEISAHHTLMVIRKKYDDMNKTREALQRSVDDMEKLREKFQAEKDRFEDEKGQGTTRVQQLEDALQGIRLQLEESDMERKVMAAMSDRLKTDKVVYDFRKYNMEKDLAYLQKQKQIILRENATKLEEEDKTRKIHQKLLDHLEAEQNERHAHLTSIQTMITEKVAMGENNELRRSQMQEIASATLQDKDQKEKNWYKVLLCCRFVQKLLRDKMNREMLKFNTVEVAFKNIKTATGVHNTSDLVKKFLNKEHAYGELLGKIADNERHIIELKVEQEQLRKERRKLETQQDQINSNRHEGKDLNREEKAMHSMAEKASNCKLLAEKLTIWIGKGIRKINSFTKQEQHEEEEEDINIDYNKTVNQLKVYLQKLAATAEEVTPVDQRVGIDSKVDLGSNNCRINLQHKEEPVDKQTLKRQGIISIDSVDQEDFVNNQRSEILKNNDKFMRELKKKHEDIRKAKLEAEPKKKEVVVEKPKPQPAES